MTDRFTVRSEFENPTYGGDDGVEVMPARMDLVFVLLFVDEHRPRDVERVAVGVEVEEGEIDAIQLPALLFIPFVENAVKHNFDSEHLSYVHLFFKVDNDRLEFRCENSKPAVAIAKSRVGGIGLTNIRRRLELLYPGRYLLEVVETENQYTVTLKLNL